MTIQEVASAVAAVGLPWCYDHFEDKTTPPYMVYYFPSENDFFADGENYANIRDLAVELYTETKDAELEADVEAALRDADLTWTKTTDYISDEKLYQTTYDMEVIIDG